MFYYVYITTNKINNKKYIGQHKTDNLNDGYLGSGRLFLKAVKKYGKDNFEKEIISFANSQEELNKLEIDLIALYNAVENDAFYNLAAGGKGRSGFTWSEEHKQYISNKLKELYATGKKIPVKIEWTEEQRKRHSELLKKEFAEEKRISPMKGKHREEVPFYGKHHTEETKQILSKIKSEQLLNDEEYRKKVFTKERSEKISKTRKEKYKNGELVSRDISGSLNPMYGKFGEENPRYNITLSQEQKNKISTKRKELYKNGSIKPPDNFPTKISVYCVERNIFYSSLRKAAKDNNCQIYQIRNCCENKRETAGNYHWKYASHANTVPSSQETA